MKNDQVKVQVVHQGKAVCGKTGYMKVEGENVVAFYLDGWGDTGRIYCSGFTRGVYLPGGGIKDYPVIYLESGNQDDDTHTEICFPEYEGYGVHSTHGGKTMAICLVKYGR